MTEPTTIRVQNALQKAQESIDQLLENSSDPEAHSRLSQAQVFIHEAQIVVSDNLFMQSFGSTAADEYLENVVPLVRASKR